MTSKKEKLIDLYIKHIKGTEQKAIVTQKKIVLCRLTNQVNRVVFDCGGLSKTYINTLVLKHLYDSKPAEEFDFIINNLHKIVKYPDSIYKNKNPKRGDWCFIKKIKNELYLSSLGNENSNLEVATAFRIRKMNYLKSYELIWSWEGDRPPS